MFCLSSEAKHLDKEANSPRTMRYLNFQHGVHARPTPVAYPEIFSGEEGGGTGEGSTNSVVENKDRENRDLAAVASYSGVLEAAVIWYKKLCKPTNTYISSES